MSQANMATANHVTLGALGAGGPYAIAGSGLMAGVDTGTRHEFDQGIDIRVTPATGGYIVSINPRSSYNRVPDLHIVSNDQDLGSEIGKIITLTCLKKD
jgi:hypothetical protein